MIALANRIAQANIDPHDMMYLREAVIMSPAVQQEGGLSRVTRSPLPPQIDRMSEASSLGTSSAENLTFF